MYEHEALGQNWNRKCQSTLMDTVARTSGNHYRQQSLETFENTNTGYLSCKENANLRRTERFKTQSLVIEADTL